MKISTLPRILLERNPLLFYAGLANIVIVLMLFFLSLVDDRTVSGVNTWYKPMKFNAAFAVFLWTFALILAYIPADRKVKWISIVLFVCMVMELIPITFQAARGVGSHFNNANTFDDTLYQIMGFFILVNTLTVVYIAVQFFKPTQGLSPALKTAIQAGLVIFILGAISGGMMVARNSHTIGIADGGAGLPFLNWSTEAGDLRAAHFFTLHALQIIPLLVWLIGNVRTVRKSSVITLSLLYAGVCIFLHYQALSGSPFISF